MLGKKNLLGHYINISFSIFLFIIRFDAVCEESHILIVKDLMWYGGRCKKSIGRFINKCIKIT